MKMHRNRIIDGYGENCSSINAQHIHSIPTYDRFSAEIFHELNEILLPILVLVTRSGNVFDASVVLSSHRDIIIELIRAVNILNSSKIRRFVVDRVLVIVFFCSTWHTKPACWDDSAQRKIWKSPQNCNPSLCQSVACHRERGTFAGKVDRRWSVQK